MSDKIYALEVRDLCYTYGEGTPFRHGALKNVSFGIEKGKICAIIGHTGSGKSTLVQMLNGLLAPDFGDVLVNGVSVVERGRAKAKKNKKSEKEKNFIKNLCFKVGLVFQYPEYQLFEETVEKDIAFGPTNMGLEPSIIEKRVHDAVKFVGLDPSLMKKSPFDLSGGQKRRVAIAGIIAMRPEILVLDEPAAGLDPTGRNEIFEGLVKYRNETGATVVIVSHSMEDMAKIADEMIVLSEGKCVMQGTRDEVFRRADELRSIGLDAPQITSLVKILRANGLPIEENLYTVEETKNAILALLKKGVQIGE